MVASGEPTSLLIRADANRRGGAGHVLRCLALAQAWQDAGGRVTFLAATLPPALRARLSTEGMAAAALSAEPGTAADARQTAELARRLQADWVVADGYHFGADYQRALKDARQHLLFVDDNGLADHHCADIVLNLNIHAREGLYANREPHTRLLLGTRYALLRREFRRWHNEPRRTPQLARKVLVTMGGGDPDNVTLTVVEALRQLEVDGLEALIVAGECNPHHEELRAAVQTLRFPVRLGQNLTDMPERMAWADAAVSAGGGTCWELAFMGLPACAVVLAENQKQTVRRLAGMDQVIDLGSAVELTEDGLCRAISGLIHDQPRRQHMSTQGRALVDGEGAERVLMRLQERKLRLRPVRENDCRLLWEWANDPAVRAAAFSSDPIPWDRHKQWFAMKLSDPKCFIFIAVDEQDGFVGQVRFDIAGDGEAAIDVSIDRTRRGAGYASLLLRMSTGEMLRMPSVRTIHALLRPDNTASRKAFENAEFMNMGVTHESGCAALHYMRSRA